MMTALPTGTVTFLFTDLEQSTRSWEDDTSSMERALARHDEIIRSAADARGGYVFSTGGDGFAIAFASAEDALGVAAAAQRALAGEKWPGELELRARMGVHTGDAHERDANYYGPSVNRAARVMDAAHGGQILVSDAVARILDAGGLVDHGLHWLKDIPTQERLWEYVTDPTAEFPPPRTLGSGAATNLPPSDESLVGRDDDVEAVRSLVREHRLVTAVGVGGIGKTRLALDVARSFLEDFSDGVWCCELAPVGEPEAVGHAVGKVIGARQRPGLAMAQSVAEFCKRRKVLFVLDNCEHVLDAAGDLVDALMSVAPGVKVLATSREALGCRGEQAYPLASLGAGGVDAPAVELFVRRAAEIAPGRLWNDVELSAIGRICRRLDGMPLAIELAAGRVRSLTPNEIEARLDNTFRVLRGGRRSIERHRTLAAAIDWSYEMLEEPSALLFERLSVFAGGCDLAAIEKVCADDVLIDELDVADLLDDLVLKSLVVAEHTSRGTTRYRQLEPLRQYAEDRLAARGESVALRDRHCVYYCGWAEGWQDRSWSDELAWRLALEAEFANLRSAIGWAIESGDADRVLRTVAAIERAQGPFLMLEIGDWAARVVELPEVDERDLASLAYATAALGYWWRAELESVSALMHRSVKLAHHDPRHWANGNVIGAVLRILGGDMEGAREIWRQVDQSEPASAMVPWVWTAWDPESPAENVTTLRRHAAATGSEIVGIMADQAEAWMAARIGNRMLAAMLHRRVIARAADVGARFFVHMSVSGLAATAGSVETFDALDLELIRTSLREQRDTGQEMDQWLVLATALAAMLQRGRAELAADIRRGLSASVWGGTPAIVDLMEVLYDEAQRAAFAADESPPAELPTLVDAVLAELDEILARS